MKFLKTFKIFESEDNELLRKTESIDDYNPYDYSKIDSENSWKYANKFPTLFDKLLENNYSFETKPLGKTILYGVVLKEPLKFYHGSDRLMKILKPMKVLIRGDKEKVLHLGDSTQAKSWGHYLYEVVIPKGVEIFQGPDGFNHVMVFDSLKPCSVNILPGWENYKDADYDKIKKEIEL